MAFNRVNPPEQAVLPDVKEAGLFGFLKELRFIVFQLWKRTGAGDDLINSNIADLNFSANLSDINDLRLQVGSGKPVTVDTTGFTVDTTKQTTDKKEA